MIAPMLDEPGVEFIGEINEGEKTEFLGQAAALLFPIDWPEPFGLVMIEAMACGTPVLAFRCGSVPEIVDDGHTGRIVSSVEEAVHTLPDVLSLDRRAVRARFEQRFSVGHMAAHYLKVYHRMARRRPTEPDIALSALAARSLATSGHGAQAALTPSAQTS
jgi:glycosyltransferase involved in cell wall biosynthesis